MYIKVSSVFACLIMLSRISQSTSCELCHFKFLGKSPFNRWKAEHLCQNIGRHWGLPDGSTNIAALKSFMQFNDVETVWLSPLRKTYDSWIWINGQAHNGVITGIQHPPYFYGLLDVENFSLTTSKWSCSDCGFVCEWQGSSCIDNDFPLKAYMKNSKRYSGRCCIDSWFAARQKCNSLGGELVQLSDKETWDNVAEYLYNSNMSSCSKRIYVGLSKERWVFEHQGEGQRIADTNFWMNGEPRAGFNCVKYQEHWIAVSCAEKFKVVCQNYQENITTYTSQKENYISMIPAIIFPIVLVPLLLVCSSFIFCFRRKGHVSSNDSTNSPDILIDLENTLSSAPTTFSLDRLQKKLTVVFFCAFNNDILLHEDVVQVTFPEIQTANIDDYSHYEQIISELLGTVRLVFVKCTTDKLSEEQSSIVLTYFQMNSTAIDIVALPGLTFTTKTHKLFQQLRDDIVFLCQGVTGVTDASCAEAIAFSLSKTRYNIKSKNALENGVIDFTIKCTCNGPHSIRLSKEMISLVKLSSQEINDLKSSTGETPSTGKLREILIDLSRTNYSYKEYLEHHMGFGELLGSNQNVIGVEGRGEAEQGEKPKKLKIVLGGTGMDKDDSELDDWQILDLGGFQLEDEDDANKSGTSAAVLLSKSLRTRQSFRRDSINLYDAQLLEEGCKINWNHYSILLKQIIDTKPHIVYLPPGIENYPIPSIVQALLHQLTEHCVVITSALLCEDGNVLTIHPEFPADRAISIRYENESKELRLSHMKPTGATVDLVVNTMLLEGYDHSWSGAIRVIALVYNILWTALQSERFDLTSFERACTTAVMQAILVDLCGCEKTNDGIFIINPEMDLPSNMVDVLIKNTSKEKIYWRGKSI